MKTTARWVSILAHPFVMVILLVGVSAWNFLPPAEALRMVLLVAGVSIVPVAILMIHQVRSGRWSDVDASTASERPILFKVALTSLVVLLLWAWFDRSGPFLRRGGIVAVLLVLVSAILTRWIKVSLHLAFAGVAATALSLLGSWTGYMLIAVVPLLAWSRLTLSRHQPFELVVGLLLGVAAGFALIHL